MKLKTQFFCTYLTSYSCASVVISTHFPFFPWIMLKARLKMRLFFNKDVKFRIVAIEWSESLTEKEKELRYKSGDAK